MPRAVFEFKLLLDGPDLTEELVASLLVKGCDDALFGVERGVKTADFHRVAARFEEAVLTAIADIESADVGLSVTRVEPDDLLTASGIADRVGVTRQNVAQMIAGQRHGGGFPAPVSTLDSRTRVWRWTDVRYWLANKLPGSFAGKEARKSHFVAAINGALDLRRNLASFGHHGGDPSVAERVRRLVPTADSSSRYPTASAVGDDDRRPGVGDDTLAPADVDEALRRVEAHFIDLRAVILDDLYAEPAIRAPWWEWIRLADEAHGRSIEARRRREWPTALSSDREVLRHSRMCFSLTLPRSLPTTPVVHRMCETFPDDHPNTDGSLRHDFKQSMGNFRTPRRTDKFVESCSSMPLRHLAFVRRDHAAVEATIRHYEFKFGEEWIASQALNGKPSLQWLNETLKFGRSPDATGYALSDDELALIVPQASLARLAITSWSLVGAVFYVALEHLPGHVVALEDVLRRLERDMDTWAGPAPLP